MAMISIYSSAFNLIKNGFDYKKSIQRFCNFADEVVICVNTSEDDTLNALIDLRKVYPNLVVVDSDYSYEDPWLDGKIKNHALQSTCGDVMIGLDMDEYIPQWQSPMWRHYAETLLADSFECYMIPSINLYRDKDHYFSITPKWYLHKKGLHRGPVNYARKPDGTINTQLSDSCELLNRFGNLASHACFPTNIDSLQKGNRPFVVHEGYIDLDARLLRNKNFWVKHWLTESGGINPPHIVHASIEDFQEQYLSHNLRL